MRFVKICELGLCLPANFVSAAHPAGSPMVPGSEGVHVEGAQRHRQLLVMKGSQNRFVRRGFKVEK